MSSSNILDEIWQSYQTTLDCFKVTDRSITKKEYHLLNRTDFISASTETAGKLINLSRSNADDYIILSLWTVFERRLFEYLKNETYIPHITKRSLAINHINA